MFILFGSFHATEIEPHGAIRFLKLCLVCLMSLGSLKGSVVTSLLDLVMSRKDWENCFLILVFTDCFSQQDI